jgi:hypothetical protein
MQFLFQYLLVEKTELLVGTPTERFAPRFQ